MNPAARSEGGHATGMSRDLTCLSIYFVDAANPRAQDSYFVRKPDAPLNWRGPFAYHIPMAIQLSHPMYWTTLPKTLRTDSSLVEDAAYRNQWGSVVFHAYRTVPPSGGLDTTTSMGSVDSQSDARCMIIFLLAPLLMIFLIGHARLSWLILAYYL